MSTTVTETLASTPSHGLGDTSPISVEILPKLNREQAGHLRHFYNLARQLDGCWNHMQPEDPGQELFDAYRFQISNMAFAMSLAHYHRLPALRGVFKPLLRRLIHKMLRRDVWGYWYLASSGSNFLDPGLKELKAPYPDPVCKDNIMYSGHLLLMTSLYTMLFDDDEFEKPDSIVFDWDPKFWGLGPQKFRYSISSLQEIILREMEENGWLGCCCEPNVVFIVCNQFHLIAMRYNDVRHGTQVLDHVLPKYTAAWEKKGWVRDNGLITFFWMKKQDATLTSPDVSQTAWASTFLHSWNPKIVEDNFDVQSQGYITKVGSEVRLQPASVANHIRQMAAQEPEGHNSSPVEADTIAAAREYVKTTATPQEKANDKNPSFGYVSSWVSELGREDILAGLLDYADKNLSPTWEDGGLFYPRNDDQGLDWTYMDPFTGNTAIAYARLNVPDGQKKMFDEPWTRDFLATRPFVDGVDLSLGVDFLRGQWLEQERALVMTCKSWDGQVHQIEPSVKNLSAGRWAVYVDGRLQRFFTCQERGEVSLSVEVGGQKELDVVLLRLE